MGDVGSEEEREVMMDHPSHDDIIQDERLQTIIFIYIYYFEEDDSFF